ncbi:MAG: hypothetical protein AB8B82_15000 [Roseovarius sp.]
MKRVLRILSGLVLSLALVLTGQSMAMARGMAPAADEIVICTGHGPVILTVDADGNPTAPAQLCHDCAMNLVQGLLTNDLVLSRMTTWQKVSPAHVTYPAVRLTLRAPQARGPPRGH